MWAAWHAITEAADEYLDTVTSELLQTRFGRDGGQDPESVGTRMYRSIYHCWYHLGEARTIREMLGHTDLPEFVGDLSAGVYRPEPG